MVGPVGFEATTTSAPGSPLPSGDSLVSSGRESSLLPLDQARRLGMLDHLSNNRPLSLLGAWSAPGDSQGKGLLRGFPSKPIVSIEYLIQLGNLFLKEVPESQASIFCLLFQDIHHPG